MLIILPPSESKRPPPSHGTPVSMDELSFPQLTPVRKTVFEALIATSSRRDALDRLLAGKSVAPEIEQNLLLATLPTRRAIETYRGVLYEALSPGELTQAAMQRIASDLVIVSSLWGAIRPDDHIPPYRLHICSNLVGLIALEPLWRSVLGPVLAEAAGKRGVVVDLRSSSYQAVGMPLDAGDRTVTTRVVGNTEGRRASSYASKQTRGALARYLLESGADPRTPQELVDALEAHWDVHLTEPKRPGRPWELSVEAVG